MQTVLKINGIAALVAAVQSHREESNSGAPRSALVAVAVHVLEVGLSRQPALGARVVRHLRLGRGVTISSFCKIKSSDGPLSIGAGTQVAPFCFITSHAGGVVIGNDCLIGPSATLAGNSYRYDDLAVPMRLQDQVSRGSASGTTFGSLPDAWCSMERTSVAERL